MEMMHQMHHLQKLAEIFDGVGQRGLFLHVEDKQKVDTSKFMCVTFSEWKSIRDGFLAGKFRLSTTYTRSVGFLLFLALASCLL